MTTKERIYNFIRENNSCPTLIQWQNFQKVVPQVRLKTVGSQRTVLICLDGTNDWQDPLIWAHNYHASIHFRFAQECQRAKNILSQEEIVGTAGIVEHQVDPSPANKEKALNRYVEAMNEYSMKLVDAVNDCNMAEITRLQLMCFERALKATLKPSAADKIVNDLWGSH
jgi:hypothetical protein